MISILLFSLSVQAAPLTEEVACLNALGKMEYGKSLEANSSPITIPYKNDGKNAIAWDGAKLWLISKPFTLRDFSSGDDRSFKVLDGFASATRKTIWDSSNFEKNGDGRTDKSFPSEDVEKIVKDFIKLSFAGFYNVPATNKAGRPLSTAHFRPGIASGCQNVQSVKIIAGDRKNEPRAIGELVKSWLPAKKAGGTNQADPKVVGESKAD